MRKNEVSKTGGAAAPDGVKLRTARRKGKEVLLHSTTPFRKGEETALFVWTALEQAKVSGEFALHAKGYFPGSGAMRQKGIAVQGVDGSKLLLKTQIEGNDTAIVLALACYEGDGAQEVESKLRTFLEESSPKKRVITVEDDEEVVSAAETLQALPSEPQWNPEASLPLSSQPVPAVDLSSFWDEENRDRFQIMYGSHHGETRPTIRLSELQILVQFTLEEGGVDESAINRAVLDESIASLVKHGLLRKLSPLQYGATFAIVEEEPQVQRANTPLVVEVQAIAEPPATELKADPLPTSRPPVPAASSAEDMASAVPAAFARRERLEREQAVFASELQKQRRALQRRKEDAASIANQRKAEFCREIPILNGDIRQAETKIARLEADLLAAKTALSAHQSKLANKESQRDQVDSDLVRVHEELDSELRALEEEGKSTLIKITAEIVECDEILERPEASLFLLGMQAARLQDNRV